MAHTAGPWRHEPYEGSHQCAIIGDCFQIATTWYDEQEHSNARLIATAPDLLAACEAVVAEFVEGDCRSHVREILEMARAAIAKARGQS